MKKAAFLILFTFKCILNFSQGTEQFIEVVVVDTLQDEPEKFIYTIYCRGDDGIASDTVALPSSFEKKDFSRKEEISLAKVRQLIKNARIDTLAEIQYSFQNEPYGSYYKNTFNLVFTSKEKLNAFIPQIREIENTTGFLSQTSTTKTSILEQRLLKRLLEKAEVQATAIATQCNKKLGKLISVKEEGVETASGWTMYPPLTGFSQYEYSNISAKIIIVKKVTVRYLW